MSGEAAAYGGPGWSPRDTSMDEELGSIWASCGVGSEWRRLEAVLLHRPGEELAGVEDADRHLMLERPDPGRARGQIDALAGAYREQGVRVHLVDPPETPPPNLVFCADLLFMTPSGAIVGRPAARVRAGEERLVARRLAAIGIPVLRTVSGRGTFEGADAAWLDPGTVLLGRGFRTNAEGAEQVARTLGELGVETIRVDLPPGAMHLMGSLRIVDRDLAFVDPDRTPQSATRILRERGFRVRPFPGGASRRSMHHNFVTLRPRTILVPRCDPDTLASYREAGLECVEVEMDEIARAAGAVGCVTGVLSRAAAG